MIYTLGILLQFPITIMNSSKYKIALPGQCYKSSDTLKEHCPLYIKFLLLSSARKEIIVDDHVITVYNLGR